MRWHRDQSGAEWTATVTPEGAVRVLRRKLSKPYREGDDPNEEFRTFVFDRSAAAALANTLQLADHDAGERIDDLENDRP